MNKEMLDIVNDLSKKPTTELALQIMELTGENLILEQQCKKQKEVIDKAINWTIKYQTEWCQGDEVIRDLKQLLDILKEVSE